MLLKAVGQQLGTLKGGKAAGQCPKAIRKPLGNSLKNCRWEPKYTLSAIRKKNMAISTSFLWISVYIY
jgi:hypothetical protein